METISVSLPVNAEALWSGVFDNLWNSWWRSLEILDENEKTMRVTAWNPEEEDYVSNTVTKDITLQDLADAYSLLLSKNTKHCGINLELDPTEFDACGSDFVLQTAMFGKIQFS